MAKLPPPMQVGDFYLAALLDEIKGLRADLALARAPAVVKTVVELPVPGAMEPAVSDAVRYVRGDRPPSDPPTKSLLQRITRR